MQINNFVAFVTKEKRYCSLCTVKKGKIIPKEKGIVSVEVNNPEFDFRAVTGAWYDFGEGLLKITTLREAESPYVFDTLKKLGYEVIVLDDNSKPCKHLDILQPSDRMQLREQGFGTVFVANGRIREAIVKGIQVDGMSSDEIIAKLKAAGIPADFHTYTENGPILATVWSVKEAQQLTEAFKDIKRSIEQRKQIAQNYSYNLVKRTLTKFFDDGGLEGIQHTDIIEYFERAGIRYEYGDVYPKKEAEARGIAKLERTLSELHKRQVCIVEVERSNHEDGKTVAFLGTLVVYFDQSSLKNVNARCVEDLERERFWVRLINRPSKRGLEYGKATLLAPFESLEQAAEILEGVSLSTGEQGLYEKLIEEIDKFLLWKQGINSLFIFQEEPSQPVLEELVRHYMDVRNCRLYLWRNVAPSTTSTGKACLLFELLVA
ncbi:MAG: hypothetical protein M1150_03990 [Patescibacteria group bacterium]|nr:hypothetical protein [Patescibacteria group bacterium]